MSDKKKSELFKEEECSIKEYMAKAQKGVNAPHYTGSSTDQGQSQAGVAARSIKTSPFPEQHKEAAVKTHKKTLKELKSMPKPKLTKEEEDIREYAEKITKAEEKATFEYHRQQAADHEATAKHHWSRYEDDSKSSDAEISRNSREHRNLANWHEGKAEQHLNSAKSLHNPMKHGPWNSTIPKGNVIKE